MITKQELKKRGMIDISSANRNQLKELTEIRIDRNQEISERLQQFIDQIENPYCFLVKGYRVRIRFDDDKKTLEQSLKNYVIKKSIHDIHNKI